MKIQKVLCLFLGLSILLCTGCQATPEQNVVISKNDGSFDVNVIESADDTRPANSTQNVSVDTQFSSSDGSVDFRFQIDQSLPDPNMSVVRVAPHFISAEDAKRAANALFPDTVFYEAEPPRSENFSKSEIQEKIERWSQYANIETLQSLYGDIYSKEALSDTSAIIKAFIQRFTLMLETAPVENPHTLCEWKMRKTSEYMLPADELNGKNLSNDNDEISLQFTYDGIPYYFTATTRDKKDFKVNMYSVYIDGGLSPANIDERIFLSQLCRKPKPTEEQVTSAAKKAEAILKALNLGEWKIDESFIQYNLYGEHSEYAICVNAVPVINGLPALRQPQLSSLKNEEGYAPNQYLTDANFQFAPNGELISFTLFTPLNIAEVINDNVKVKTVDDLLKRAQELFELTDSYAYGLGTYLANIDEDIQCNVTISEMEYALTRVRVPNSDDQYYYVPAVSFKGYAEYIGQKTGKYYYQDDSAFTLLTINAIDGTVINNTNS